MPYQLSDGNDIAVLYETLQPGMPQAAAVGMQADNGADLSAYFCAISAGARNPQNSGFQLADGRDLSDVFAARGTVITSLPFDGKIWSSTSHGATGTVGQIQATTSFNVNTDGTYTTSGSNTFRGGRVFEHGSIWTYGSPGDWEYRVYGTNGTNYDSGWRNGTTSMGVSASAARNPGQEGQDEDHKYYMFETRRVGSANNSATAAFSLFAGVYSWV